MATLRKPLAPDNTRRGRITREPRLLHSKELTDYISPSLVPQAGRIRRSRPVAEEESTIALSPNLPTPYFLMEWSRPLSWKLSIYMITSFLYYQMNRSLITDHEYDRLCVELLEGFDTFEHQHKYLVTKAMLRAGTAFSIKDYPRMVVLAANHALTAFKER